MPARVKNIKKSQAEYTCSSCGDTIPAGSPYRYFKPGFRGRLKVRRCMKPECAPRDSELSNSKMSGVYEAREDAETEIRALKWDDTISFEDAVQDIENALNQAAEASEEIAAEYDEAIEATPMLEDKVGELRDGIRDWVSELESWQADEPSPEPDDDEGTEARQEWLAECSEAFDQAIESAIETLGNLSV